MRVERLAGFQRSLGYTAEAMVGKAVSRLGIDDGSANRPIATTIGSASSGSV
jgi:aconitase B